MQTPEKLTLIGGSILLASTLVFTLKSQASQIIPNVGHSISNVFNHIGDAQRTSDFNSSFKYAQQKDWKTGHWGTAPYYVDNQMNMHVGSGQLADDLSHMLGLNISSKLHTLNFDGNVQAPTESSWLLAVSPHIHNNTLQAINGLENMDTSHVVNMQSMFESEASPRSLNVSNWDTHNVKQMGNVFSTINNIEDIDLSHWSTSNVIQSQAMFWDDYDLQDLNLSHFNISSPEGNNSMFAMFHGANFYRLTLGNDTRLSSNVNLPNGIWKNSGQTLSSQQLSDGNAHPGTWTKQ